jgi:hypothetical protein
LSFSENSLTDENSNTTNKYSLKDSSSTPNAKITDEIERKLSHNENLLEILDESENND